VTQTTRRYHYVPEFLLKRWAPKPNDGNVCGYYWNRHRSDLSCLVRGAKAFCYGLDLFAVGVQTLPSDILETAFFGPIDTQGAAVADKLVQDGPNALTGDDRCDFTRFLFSLEHRQPHRIQYLRKQGPKILEKDIDNDRGLRSTLQQHDFHEAPSIYARELGLLSEDRALAQVQKLVDDQDYGQKFINWHWSIARTRPDRGSFILSDRPLVRVNAFDSHEALWLLPLGPYTVFYASKRETPRVVANEREFLKSLNRHSVRQAQKYVFCIDGSHRSLLHKHMRTTL